MPLTPAQHRAVISLLTERSPSAAAIKAGVSDRSLREWMHNAEFCEALAAGRAAIMAGIVSTMSGIAQIATRRLAELIDNPNTDLGTLMDAIKVVLTLAISENDKAQLLRRLEALERTSSRGVQDGWEESRPLLEGGKQ